MIDSNSVNWTWFAEDNEDKMHRNMSQDNVLTAQKKYVNT